MKAKIPTVKEVQSSLDSLWQHVDDDYVNCHRQAAIWSSRSIEKSRGYSKDAKRRAKPIIKFIAALCEEYGAKWTGHETVHLIDHSKNPPEIAPYIVATMYLPEFLWCKMEVKLYKPKKIEDVEGPIRLALRALTALKDEY